MTGRLYYDCAIKAAYMSKYFGVKILATKHGELVGGYEDIDLVYWEGECVLSEPYYIAPESEGIFVPVDGDLCRYAEYDNDGDFLDWEYGEYGGCYPMNDMFDSIIQRSNTAFIHPKRESDESLA